MSRTGTDKEARGDEYCLERTDFETCRKSVWSPERRERLVSPIGDRLRVTRDRVMRKRLSQADRRRRTVTKKAHSERKTRASIRTNPVLSKGHPQDVAHPATAKQAESDSETELYSVASLSETAHSQLLLTESVTQGREQTGSGQDRDPDGSRRRVGLEPTPTREQAGRARTAFATEDIAYWRSKVLSCVWGGRPTIKVRVSVHGSGQNVYRIINSRFPDHFVGLTGSTKSFIKSRLTCCVKYYNLLKRVYPRGSCFSLLIYRELLSRIIV